MRDTFNPILFQNQVDQSNNTKSTSDRLDELLGVRQPKLDHLKSDNVDFSELVDSNKTSSGTSNKINYNIIDILSDIKVILTSILDFNIKSLDIQTLNLKHTKTSEFATTKYDINVVNAINSLVDTVEMSTKDSLKVYSTEMPNKFKEFIDDIAFEYKSGITGRSNDFSKLMRSKMEVLETKIAMPPAMIKLYTTSAQSLFSTNSQASPDSLKIVFLSSIYDTLRYFALDFKAHSRNESVSDLLGTIANDLQIGFFKRLSLASAAFWKSTPFVRFLSPIIVTLKLLNKSIGTVLDISASAMKGVWEFVTGNKKRERANAEIIKKFSVKKSPDIITAEAISKVPSILESQRILLLHILETLQNSYSLENQLLLSMTGVGHVFEETQKKEERIYVKELGEFLTKSEYSFYNAKKKSAVRDEIDNSLGLFRGLITSKEKRNKRTDELVKEIDSNNRLTNDNSLSEIMNVREANLGSTASIGAQKASGVSATSGIETSLSTMINLLTDIKFYAGNLFYFSSGTGGYSGLTLPTLFIDLIESSFKIYDWLLKEKVFIPQTAATTSIGPIPRRSGGPVNQNELYLVGEEGPELFTPKTSGTIIPNQSLFDYELLTDVIITAINKSEVGLAAIEDRKIDTHERLALLRNQQSPVATSPSPINIINEDNKNKPEKKKGFFARLFDLIPNSVLIGGALIAAPMIMPLIGSALKSLLEIILGEKTVAVIGSLIPDFITDFFKNGPILTKIAVIAGGIMIAPAVLSGIGFAIGATLVRMITGSIGFIGKNILKLLKPSILFPVLKDKIFPLFKTFLGRIIGGVFSFALDGILGGLEAKKEGGGVLDIIGGAFKGALTSGSITGNALKYGMAGLMMGGPPGMIIGALIGAGIQYLVDNWDNIVGFAKDKVKGMLNLISDIKTYITDGIIGFLQNIASKLYLDRLMELDVTSKAAIKLHEKNEYKSSKEIEEGKVEVFFGNDRRIMTTDDFNEFKEKAGIEGRASGGPVTNQTPYLVGETGPELFIPKIDGEIIPLINETLNKFVGSVSSTASSISNSAIKAAKLEKIKFIENSLIKRLETEIPISIDKVNENEYLVQFNDTDQYLISKDQMPTAFFKIKTIYEDNLESFKDKESTSGLTASEIRELAAKKKKDQEKIDLQSMSELLSDPDKLRELIDTGSRGLQGVLDKVGDGRKWQESLDKILNPNYIPEPRGTVSGSLSFGGVRDVGGEVVPNKTYLVARKETFVSDDGKTATSIGQYGPELFTPSKTGYVFPNSNLMNENDSLRQILETTNDSSQWIDNNLQSSATTNKGAQYYSHLKNNLSLPNIQPLVESGLNSQIVSDVKSGTSNLIAGAGQLVESGLNSQTVADVKSGTQELVSSGLNSQAVADIKTSTEELVTGLSSLVSSGLNSDLYNDIKDTTLSYAQQGIGVVKDVGSSASNIISNNKSEIQNKSIENAILTKIKNGSTVSIIQKTKNGNYFIQFQDLQSFIITKDMPELLTIIEKMYNEKLELYTKAAKDTGLTSKKLDALETKLLKDQTELTTQTAMEIAEKSAKEFTDQFKKSIETFTDSESFAKMQKVAMSIFEEIGDGRKWQEGLDKLLHPGGLTPGYDQLSTLPGFKPNTVRGTRSGSLAPSTHGLTIKDLDYLSSTSSAIPIDTSAATLSTSAGAIPSLPLEAAALSSAVSTSDFGSLLSQGMSIIETDAYKFTKFQKSEIVVLNQIRNLLYYILSGTKLGGAGGGGGVLPGAVGSFPGLPSIFDQSMGGIPGIPSGGIPGIPGLGIPGVPGSMGGGGVPGVPGSMGGASGGSLSGPAPMADVIDTDASRTRDKLGVSKEEYDVFRKTIAHIESKGKYNISGGSGGKYDGAYQMGHDAKIDAARALGIAVPSREDFKANPELQERMFDAYTTQNHKTLMKLSPQYKAMSPQKQMEVLGYAHNQGAGGAIKYLKTGKAEADDFGTIATKYSKAISGNLDELKRQQSGQVNPATGQPIAGVSGQVNPVTGQPIAGVSGSIDPSLIDPNNPMAQSVITPGTLSELKSRAAGKHIDVDNLDASYAGSLGSFMKEAEEVFGKKLTVQSAYRPPTKAERDLLGSNATSQQEIIERQGKSGRVASTYGSKHGTGQATDLRFEGMRSINDMNNMSESDKKKWLELAQKHNLDLPLRDRGKDTEWWHVEPAGLKRGGSTLRGQEYADDIRRKSLKTAELQQQQLQQQQLQQQAKQSPKTDPNQSIATEPNIQLDPNANPLIDPKTASIATEPSIDFDLLSKDLNAGRGFASSGIDLTYDSPNLSDPSQMLSGLQTSSEITQVSKQVNPVTKQPIAGVSGQVNPITGQPINPSLLTGANSGLLAVGSTYKGLHEVKDNAALKKLVGQEVAGDSNPWCGGFVGGVLKESGYGIPKGHMASKSYLKYGEGVDIASAQPGDIAVFNRGDDASKGHIGIIQKIEGDKVHLLGGNQGDSVTVSINDINKPGSELVGIRRPSQSDIIDPVKVAQTQAMGGINPNAITTAASQTTVGGINTEVKKVESQIITDATQPVPQQSPSGTTHPVTQQSPISTTQPVTTASIATEPTIDFDTLSKDLNAGRGTASSGIDLTYDSPNLSDPSQMLSGLQTASEIAGSLQGTSERQILSDLIKKTIAQPDSEDKVRQLSELVKMKRTLDAADAAKLTTSEVQTKEKTLAEREAILKSEAEYEAKAKVTESVATSKPIVSVETIKPVSPTVIKPVTSDSTPIVAKEGSLSGSVATEISPERQELSDLIKKTMAQPDSEDKVRQLEQLVQMKRDLDAIDAAKLTTSKPQVDETKPEKTLAEREAILKAEAEYESRAKLAESVATSKPITSTEPIKPATSASIVEIPNRPIIDGIPRSPSIFKPTTTPNFDPYVSRLPTTPNFDPYSILGSARGSVDKILASVFGTDGIGGLMSGIIKDEKSGLLSQLLSQNPALTKGMDLASSVLGGSGLNGIFSGLFGKLGLGGLLGSVTSKMGGGILGRMGSKLLGGVLNPIMSGLTKGLGGLLGGAGSFLGGGFDILKSAGSGILKDIGGIGKFLGGGFDILGQAGTGIMSDIGGVIPGRASGGPVMSDNPYIVGEKGPELFVPQSHGNIVPSIKLNPPQTQFNTTATTNTLIKEHSQDKLNSLSSTTSPTTADNKNSSLAAPTKDIGDIVQARHHAPSAVDGTSSSLTTDINTTPVDPLGDNIADRLFSLLGPTLLYNLKSQAIETSQNNYIENTSFS